MKRKPSKGRGFLFLFLTVVVVFLLFSETFRGISLFYTVVLGVILLAKNPRENLINDLKAVFGEEVAVPASSNISYGSGSLRNLGDLSRDAERPVQAIVYSIKLPKDVTFQAEKAVALIQKLITLRPIALRIQATAGEIVWKVIDLNQPPYNSDVIVNAIHSVYLDAEVSEGVPYQEPSVERPFWRMVEFFGQIVEFPMPILYPDNLGKTDPLTVVGNIMSQLAPGENVSYTVYLGAADEDGQLYKQGEELIRHSKMRSAIADAPDTGTISGDLTAMAAAALLSPVLGKQKPKYDDASMRVFYEKMNGLMLYSAVAIEANSPSEDRLANFDFQPAILQFRTDYQLLGRTKTEGVEFDFVKSDADNNRTSSLRLMHTRVMSSLEVVDSRRCVLNVAEIASLWHLPHSAMTAPEIVWIKGKQIAAPPAFCGKREGVFLGMNKSGGRSSEIYQPTQERTTHTLVIGKTGVGKTSFMQALVAQDIEAGRGVAVIDPLGSFVRRILQHHIPEAREDDLVVLDIDYQFEEDGGKVRYPPPLNLLARPKDLEDTEASAGSVVSVLAKVFDESEASRFMIILTNAVLLLGAETSPTLLDIEPIILDSEYRNRLLKQIDLRGVQRFWKMFDETYGMQKASVLSALQRLAPFYNNRLLEPITCHPDTLDFSDLIAKNKIVLVSVHADEKRVPELQRNILGATVVSQIQMAALAGAVADPKNRPFILYVDEVQAFVTSSLDTLARQARQKGLGLVAATQTLKSLSGKTLDAFLGNVGSIVAFESDEPDAKLVLPQMRPFETSDLMSMGKYRAVVSMRPEGGTSRAAFSLEPVSAPDVSQDEALIARELYLRRKSVENYTPKTTAQVKAWLDERYNPQTTPPTAPEKQQPIAPSDDFSDPV
jgi:hypothetical protein